MVNGGILTMEPVDANVGVYDLKVSIQYNNSYSAIIPFSLEVIRNFKIDYLYNKTHNSTNSTNNSLSQNISLVTTQYLTAYIKSITS